mmetsp:Transcript_11317/g.21431  ORF Transcript_11317/g.21431 Transcript_11317/m.21431 type:complete len:284 (-) Transcript_11317:1942-2793(-)
MTGPGWTMLFMRSASCIVKEADRPGGCRGMTGRFPWAIITSGILGMRGTDATLLTSLLPSTLRGLAAGAGEFPRGRLMERLPEISVTASRPEGPDAPPRMIDCCVLSMLAASLLASSVLILLGPRIGAGDERPMAGLPGDDLPGPDAGAAIVGGAPLATGGDACRQDAPGDLRESGTVGSGVTAAGATAGLTTSRDSCLPSVGPPGIIGMALGVITRGSLGTNRAALREAVREPAPTRFEGGITVTPPTGASCVGVSDCWPCEEISETLASGGWQSGKPAALL